MPLDHFRGLGPKTIGAGETVDFTWDSDGDYIIHRIFIIEASGRTLSKSTVTIMIDSVAVTKDSVPCSVFGPDTLVSPVLDIPLGKGRKFSASIKNNEGVDIEVYVVLELHKA